MDVLCVISWEFSLLAFTNTKPGFAYAILAADEIVAVSNTVAFKYDDGRTYLNWVVGGEVDAAVWIALFLVIVVCINMLPVKVDILRL